MAEKRQRVNLSSKYEEAVEDINHQLADVKAMLHALTIAKSQSPSESSQKTHPTPRSMIDEKLPNLSNVNDSYNGDTSFHSYAIRVNNALEATLPVGLGADATPAHLPQIELPDDSSGNAARESAVGSNLHSKDLDFSTMPLPPMEIILKILRLAKIEKQRFFVDVPMLKEDDFVAMCRRVYFATDPVSLWDWICINVGLYYLCTNLTAETCEAFGTTVDQMRAHGDLLRSNTEAAMQSLRLCSEPSLESCRALCLLVSCVDMLYMLYD